MSGYKAKGWMSPFSHHRADRGSFRRRRRFAFPRRLNVPRQDQLQRLPLSLAVPRPVFLNEFKQKILQAVGVLLYVQPRYLQAEIEENECSPHLRVHCP